MDREESEWDDLPEWVKDFLDKNELTELVWNYLKKRVPYDTFKDWTFEELRAIKFRANVLNRAKVSQTSPVEPLELLYSPYEEEQADPTEPLPLAHYRRAQTWDNQKDYDKAIADYSKAIELDPQFVEAYNNRGIDREKQKDYEKAIADYSKAIDLSPGYAAAYNNRGNAWGDKKDYEKAIADYAKAIELDPRYAAAYNNRGTAWGEKKDYDKAIVDFSKAIELDPRYAEAYYNRGVVWDKKRDYDKAIADHSRAIEISPKFAKAYYNRGNVWGEKKDYDKAIVDFSKAIEINPNDAEAYYHRGHAWNDKKDYDKAIADYAKAIEINPKGAEAYLNPDDEDESASSESANVLTKETSRSERSELEEIIRSSYEGFGAGSLPGFTNGWSDEIVHFQLELFRVKKARMRRNKAERDELKKRSRSEYLNMEADYIDGWTDEVVHAQLEQMRAKEETKTQSKYKYSELPQKPSKELRGRFKDSLPLSGPTASDYTEYAEVGSIVILHSGTIFGTILSIRVVDNDSLADDCGRSFRRFDVHWDDGSYSTVRDADVNIFPPSGPTTSDDQEYDRQWLMNSIFAYQPTLLAGESPVEISFDDWTNEDLYDYARSYDPNIPKRPSALSLPTDELNKTLDMVNDRRGEFYAIDEDGNIISRVMPMAKDPQTFRIETSDGKTFFCSRNKLKKRIKTWEIRSILLAAEQRRTEPKA